MRQNARVWSFIAVAILAACGPRAVIPPLPSTIPGSLSPDDSSARLARSLAPILYLQPDEPFALSRVVAVVHPTHPVIAYHMLWSDDAHGAWIPFTKPIDEEIVWIGYDAEGAPTDVWTYWHGSILHSDWRGKGPTAIDVQWGKHGSLPRATRPGDLPWHRSLDVFFLMAWLGMPDLWLGTLSRPGPRCFCGGFGSYTTFTQSMPLAPRINVVVRTVDPRAALIAVFSARYADKPLWPPGME